MHSGEEGVLVGTGFRGWSRGRLVVVREDHDGFFITFVLPASKGHML